MGIGRSVSSSNIIFWLTVSLKFSIISLMACEGTCWRVSYILNSFTNVCSEFLMPFSRLQSITEKSIKKIPFRVSFKPPLILTLSPLAPWLPLSPRGPVCPVTPSSPLSPLGPTGPGSPRSPDSPFTPGKPRCPWMPFSPGKP